jgi:alpha-tubulin suppressor-like RCC1 family protein
VKAAVLGLIALVAVFAACGGGATPEGVEGGHCYPNNSCNTGLSCYSNLCVRIAPGGAGAAGAGGNSTAGAGGTAAVGGAGDVPAVCGDGVVEGTEVCDDGGPSETCSAACEVIPRVTIGVAHSCSLGKAGNVTCWGDNSLGQLAVNATQRFRQISAGDWHTCGVTLAGALTCWGDNKSGQASPPVGRFRWVSAGVYHTCGLRETGAVVCWGFGSTGSNCDPNNYTYDCGQAESPSGAFAHLDAGAFHNCALDAAGNATCWGDDEYGQSDPFAGTFVSLTSGTLISCGIDQGGRLACWGDLADVGGALPAGGPYVQASAGVLHACVLDTSGAVTCWGDDTFGQIDVPPLGGAAISVEAARAHSCAIVEQVGAFQVRCWGAGLDASDCDLTQSHYQCGQSNPPPGVP